jgi:hypothetical protein
MCYIRLADAVVRAVERTILPKRQLPNPQKSRKGPLSFDKDVRADVARSGRLMHAWPA